MGRQKVKMELISKRRSRMLTFKKRKAGLMKKLYELTTLCDVSACMIIYGHTQKNRGVEPEIWPQNPDEIRPIIEVYKSKSKDDSGKCNSFGLSDFFHQRKMKVDEELIKLRKKNVEAKYPSWNELLNSLNESALRGFAAALKDKMQFVKSRIEFLKREKQEFEMMNNMMMMRDFASSNLSQFYTQNQNQEINPFMDAGSSSMNLLQYDSCGKFSSLEQQVFYDQARVAGDGLGNLMFCNNHTGPLRQINYAPPMLPPPPPPPTPQLRQPYMHWPAVNLNYHDDGDEDDISRYLMPFN